MIESPFTSQGLIRDLAEYILRRTDTNPSFAETCASVLVSAAVGPNIIIADQKGDVYLNLFGIIVGGSGISNKTVALDIVREIIRSLSTEIKNNLTLPQKFSIEGLSLYLTKHREGVIIGDEYTAMFQSAGKSWLRDTMEFLSNLYSGYLPMYVTIARGTEYVSEICVGFLSATTPYLLRLMRTDDFFLQGTGCRFLWDLDLSRSKVDENSVSGAIFFLDPAQREQLSKELERYVHELVKLRRITENVAEISSINKGILNMSMEAAAELGKYRLQKINQAVDLFNENVLNADTGYVMRLAENAIKLAGLHCVSRSYKDEMSVLEGMEVSKEDVDWATAKTEHHFKMYLALKELRDKIHRDKSTWSHQTDFQKVLNCIDAKGGSASISQVMHRTGWLTKEAQVIIKAMIHNKMIVGKKRTGKGPHTYTYSRAEEVNY